MLLFFKKLSFCFTLLFLLQGSFYLFAAIKEDGIYIQSSASQKGALAIAYIHCLVSYMLVSLKVVLLNHPFFRTNISPPSLLQTLSMEILPPSTALWKRLR